MCWTSPKDTYIFKVENIGERGMGPHRSLQLSDAHGAKCVAVGLVSTANAVGHIAARPLDSSRQWEVATTRHSADP